MVILEQAPVFQIPVPIKMFGTRILAHSRIKFWGYKDCIQSEMGKESRRK